MTMYESLSLMLTFGALILAMIHLIIVIIKLLHKK